jgi:hypothetical protein
MGFYLKSFRPLLHGMLLFETDDIDEAERRLQDLNSADTAPGVQGIVFQDSFFGPDMDRLMYALKKLERHSFSFGSITRQRYLEIRQKNKTSTRIEAEALALINELLAYLHAIAQKIASVLVSSGPQSGSVTGEPDSSEFGAVTVNPITIPFAGKVIKNQGVLAGKTVRDALVDTTGISYGIGLFMADPAVLGVIQREHPLGLEIDDIMRLVQRIAPPRVFLAFLEKYAL